MPPKTPAKANATSKSKLPGSNAPVGVPVVAAVTGIILALFAGLAFSAGGPREALWKYARVPCPRRRNAIFVGIASYCDKELDLTLTQLFGRAKLPQRVYVGLVLQEHKAIRDGPELSRWRSHPNVRMIEFEPKESKGAGWYPNRYTSWRGLLPPAEPSPLHSRVGRGVRRPPLPAQPSLPAILSYVHNTENATGWTIS